MMTLFSQKNPEYADNKIGSSDLTIGGWGCLICCLSMLSTCFNSANCLTPPQIAAMKDWFNAEGRILWGKVNIHGLKYDGRLYRFDDKTVQLATKDPNRCVLIEVQFGQWTHWVVAVKKDLFYGWRIADPLTGTYRWMPSIYKPIGCALFSRD